MKKNHYLDMSDFIMLAIKHQRKVMAFPIHEYWIDIGRYETYQRAEQEWDNY